MWSVLSYTYAIEHSDKIKDSVDTNLDPRSTFFTWLYAPVLVDDRADDEHGRAHRHETATPEPTLLREDLGRLVDHGPVDDDFLGPVGLLEQLVVRLDGDLDTSVARLLDFVDVGDFVCHVTTFLLVMNIDGLTPSTFSPRTRLRSHRELRRSSEHG